MSGMDERAKQFKTAAEAQPTGPALLKEVNTLRRFLFRNQEYRFTKAAQQALYMAIIAHHGNAAAHHASCYAAAVASAPASRATATAGTGVGPSGSPAAGATVATTARVDSDREEGDGDAADAADAPVLRLLDDALKMPFTVFTSAQKDKLLALYWGVLGTNGGGAPAGGGGGAAAAATQTLSLVDLSEVGKKKVQLALITDDGEEYPQEVLVTDADTIKRLKAEFDKGSTVSVTVQETDTGATFVSFSVEDE